MSFFDAPMPATEASMPVPEALDASMPVTDAPVDELCKKRRVRATSEEDDEPEKVVEGVEKDKKELLTLQFEADAGAVVEAYAKRPRAPLAVTKETILAAIDRGDKDYLRLHCRTTKNTVNKLFANTRDSFSTVEENAAGQKRVMSATTLARAIYRFATAPTEEAAIAHHAVIEVLLKHCGVTVSDQKDDFLRFMAVDAWQMARKTPEVPNDPSRHSPLKRRLLLARLILQADPTWLVDKASIIETLQTFIVLRKAEFMTLYHQIQFRDRKSNQLSDPIQTKAIKY